MNPPPGMAFDENRQPVPVYHAPEPPLSVKLLDSLREGGAVIPNDGKAIEAIESAFDRAGDERAAEALGLILQELGEDSAAALELKRIIKYGTLLHNSPEVKVARWLKKKFGKG